MALVQVEARAEVAFLAGDRRPYLRFRGRLVTGRHNELVLVVVVSDDYCYDAPFHRIERYFRAQYVGVDGLAVAGPCLRDLPVVDGVDEVGVTGVTRAEWPADINDDDSVPYMR